MTSRPATTATTVAPPGQHLSVSVLGSPGTWCGERWEEAFCVTDPERVTCVSCLSLADDFGDRAKRAYKKLAHALFRREEASRSSSRKRTRRG